ncbi:MAG: type II toxin-antitoxin system VapC family toxin [Deltaproteobacteria bacterium]|nr:type II toxin-antitoxin system VapC family toxin [Deltaproteobacteria bacterium]MBW1816411.1 type II toxin-antitoxin system VapC family toxin [Deltaproteobacteria bacterium]
MKVLLDTHAFLWLLSGDHRLSEKARKTFLNSGNELFFSAASLWEMCIKISLGKISMKKGWYEAVQSEMEANAIQWLPIDMPHCERLAKLPFHHRDPFDRMLIAQAIVEDMQLLSRDTCLSAYDIHRVW